MDAKQQIPERLLESMRCYLWLLADGMLDDQIKGKVAPSDIVQQTYMDAHRDFESFQGCTHEEMRAWIRRILVNKVHTTQRLFRTKKREIGRELGDGSVSESPAIQRSVSSLLSLQEDFDRLESALAKLPRDYRIAIESRSLNQMSFTELAELLDRTPEAARKLWYRGLLMLQKHFGDLP